MRNTVPQDFLNEARKSNLSTELASEFYIHKTGKKSLENIRAKLVLTGLAPSHEAASKILNLVWKNYSYLKFNPSPVVQPKIELDKLTYIEEASRNLDSIIGKIEVEKHFPTSFPNLVYKRIAIAGDFHFPFVNQRAIAELLDDPADTLVIMGDYFDMYSASKYRQTTDRIAVSEELAIGMAYMNKLAAKFDKIYMIKGNHDARGMKRIQETFPQLLPLFVHPVDLIASKFNNVEVISHTVENTAPLIDGGQDVHLDFMGQFNDCLFGHWEQFCGVDAPRLADSWVNEWGHILNLEPNPRAIFQAHTHRLQMEFTSKGRLLVGTGCMCLPMQYQFDGHGKYKPPTVGYVAINQVNGLTDLNSVELNYIGVN